MSAADAEKKPEAEKAAEPATAGELLYCGGTNWETLGRKVGGGNFNLVSPTRLRPLVGVDIRFVASGSASCHCVALDMEGRCYTWGRNEKGQLGHGDTLHRSLPTIVSVLSKHIIVRASAGRNHTVVVTDDGKSFSFGTNKNGQLGTGLIKNEIESTPVPCLVSQVTNASCGAEFTVWLSSVEGASILSAGLPQYGQLGHGTDNEYNSKDGSVRLAYEPQPRPRAIARFSGKTIVKSACGNNHTVAVDSDGFVYTWGYGGYGRLGHREQKDEWTPRLVEAFQRHNLLPPNAIVSAGSVSSACTAGGGQLYMWGKMKNTGDDWMYPKPVMDLSGWNIRCMASGNLTHVVGADDSCISWGHAQYGELGYGPLGQKSSANPKKIDILNGMHVTSVGCGTGLSLIVVDRTNLGDQLDQTACSYDRRQERELVDGWKFMTVKLLLKEQKKTQTETAVTKQTSKKATANSSPSPKKRKKQQDSESEDEEGESEEDDTHGEIGSTKGNRGGRVSNRGRGRGAKKSAVVKSPGRGRGRHRASDQEGKETSGRGRGRGRSGKRGKSRR